VKKLILILFAMLLAACGDDPVNTTTNGGPDAGGPDSTTNQTGQARLDLLTETAPTVTYSSRVAIRVQFLDGNDNPVADRSIGFATDGELGGSSLSGQIAMTGESGMAQVEVVAGNTQTEFTVTVSVSDDDTVTPVVVTVSVAPKDSSDYIIRVNYAGPIPLHEVTVALYDAEGTCDSLERSPTAPPSSDTPYTSVVLRPNVSGEIADRSLDSPSNVRYHYAVARGEPRGDGTEGAGYFVTFGCIDGLEEPNPAATTVIEIDLDNLWPEIESTYRIQTQINLLNAIPDSAETYVDTFIEVFENPGLGVLKLVALAATATGDEDYWDVSPWSYLFEENSDGEVVATTIGLVVGGVLDGFITSGLEASGEFGDTVSAISDAIEDLLDNSQNFTLHGDLVIAADPDASGSLGDENEIRFDKLTLRWGDVDYNIQLRSGSFIEATGLSASLTFHPDEEESYAIDIDDFDLNLNYGDVIMWVIESVVFPRLMGEEVDSFEAFFDTIVDCDELGDRMNCEGDFADGGDRADECIDETEGLGLGGVATTACEGFGAVAVETLEDFISNQTADVSNFFRMKTPDDDPCIVGFSSTTDAFAVTTLGDETEDDQCAWDANIRFSDAPEEAGESMEADWWGEKL